MTFTPKTFQTLVEDQVAAIQSNLPALVDFTPGSPMLAIVEANAGNALFLEALMYGVLLVTRAATSTGTDLDSWMADYGLTRLPAVAAVGNLTYSRMTPSGQAVVPPGAAAKTFDLSLGFTVTTDTTNAAYNAIAGGYVMANAIASVSVPAAAALAGAAGNVQANTITVISSSVSGVDSVTNPAAFTGGYDAESDAAFRARFVLYIASLSQATKIAVAYAITSFQQGLQYQIVENTDYASGATVYGQFYVIIDDGTGSPPTALIQSIESIIEPIRPLGIRYGVYGPTITTANVGMTLTTATGYDHPTVVGIVEGALATAINNLGLGNGLPWSRLEQIAYDASPGVGNVAAVLLNGATSDIAPNPKVTIKPGSITVA